MNVMSHARARWAALALTLSLAACGPSDADVTKAVADAATKIPGTSISVTDGVVTIAGQYANEAQKTAAESSLKSINGVKSVVDNASIAPPPVVMSADDSLRSNVANALRTYGTVSSQVQDGVVTLGGSIKKADLDNIMKALSDVHPKKIENKATITK